MDLIGAYNDSSDSDSEQFSAELEMAAPGHAGDDQVPRLLSFSKPHQQQQTSASGVSVGHSLVRSDCIDKPVNQCQWNDQIVNQNKSLGQCQSLRSPRRSPAESDSTLAGTNQHSIQDEAAAIDESIEQKTHHAHEIDFFGLTCGNDDDDHQDEIKARDTPVHVKRQTDQDPATESDHVPQSKFWRGDDDLIDWSNQKSLWKLKEGDIPSSGSEGKSSPCSHTNRTRASISQPGCKSNYQSLFVDNHNANMKLEKSCFFVHHKIAAASGRRVSSRPPEKQTCQLSGHPGAVNRVAWCEGNHSHLLLSAGSDGTARVWNVFSNVEMCVQTLRHHTKAVTDAKWLSSRRQVLTTSYDRTSCLQDVETGTCVSRYEESGYVKCAALHPVNHHVFVTGATNCLTAWDTRAPSKPLRTFSYKDKFGQVQDVVFCGADSAEFFTCNDLVTRDSADRNIMAWDFNKGVAVSNQIYQERYTCCRLRVHGDRLLVQSQGDYIAVFSVLRPYKMNKCLRYQAHKVSGYSVGFDVSVDGRLMVSGSHDGNIPVYDYRTGRVLSRLSAHDEVVLDTAWHPLLPSTVAMATWGGTISVWS